MVYFLFISFIFIAVKEYKIKLKKTGDKTGFFTRLIYIQIKKEMVKVWVS